MKALKILFGAVLALLILLALGVAAIMLWVDPNDYKKELEKLAADQGAELRIEGDLGWSFYPALGIRSGKLSIKPPASLDPDNKLAQPVSFSGMRVSTQIMPLLQGQLMADQLQVQGGDLTLQDMASQQTTTIKNLNLSVDGFNLQQKTFVFSISLDLATAQGDEPAQQVTLASEATLRLDKEMQRISITKSEHDIVLRTAAAGPQPVRIHAAFPVELDLEKQQAQLKDLQLTVDDSHFSGSVDAAFGSAPFYQIVLKGDKLDVDRYSAPTPSTVPKSASPAEKKDEALIPVASLLAFPGHYTFFLQSLKAGNLRMTDVNLALDITPKGVLTLQDLRTKMYGGQFSLQGTVDVQPAEPLVTLSAALTPLQLEPALKDFLQVQQAPASGDISLKAQLSTRGLTQEQLMDALNGTVTLASENLVAQNIKTSNLNALIQIAPHGNITIKQMKTKLYGGELALQGNVNIQQEKPVFAMDVDLSPIQLEPAMKDYLQVEKTFASGDFGFKGKLKGRGASADDILQALEGEVSFASANMSLNQVDITSSLDASLLQLLQVHLPKLMTAETRTVLSRLQGNTKIQNGVVQNTGLTARMLCAELGGKGQYNLLSSGLEYQLGITFPSADENKTCGEINSRLKDIAWPVVCKGSMVDDPAKLCRVDTEKMQSMLAKSVKKEADQKLEKKVDEQLKKKFGTESDQIKDALKGLLR